MFRELFKLTDGGTIALDWLMHTDGTLLSACSKLLNFVAYQTKDFCFIYQAHGSKKSYLESNRILRESCQIPLTLVLQQFLT